MAEVQEVGSVEVEVQRKLPLHREVDAIAHAGLEVLRFEVRRRTEVLIAAERVAGRQDQRIRRGEGVT